MAFFLGKSVAKTVYSTPQNNRPFSRFSCFRKEERRGGKRTGVGEGSGKERG